MWLLYVSLLFCSTTTIQAGALPPQQPRHLPEECELVLNFNDLVTYVDKDFIQDEIDKYERDHTATWYTTNGDTNPLKMQLNKTVENTRGESVILPLVIKAQISPSTLTTVPRRPSNIPQAARTNIAKMLPDPQNTIHDAGHLIAFQNGGPDDVVNFAPQSPALNVGPWKTMETQIKKAVKHWNEHVEMTIVVYYDETIKTLPVVFGVRLGLNILHELVFCEMLFENNLESGTRRGKKRTADIMNSVAAKRRRLH